MRSDPWNKAGRTIVFDHPVGVERRLRAKWWDGFGAGCIVGMLLLALAMKVLP